MNVHLNTKTSRFSRRLTFPEESTNLHEISIHSTMKMPQSPPPYRVESLDTASLGKILHLALDETTKRNYLHWDKLRFHVPPEGFTHKEWWTALKFARMGALKSIGLKDRKGGPFKFAVPELVAAALHQIDLGAGGMVSIPAPIANPHTRGRYLVRSLMEEAITSSQLEGALTTREVAKDMIRTGRKPRDTSEQMILNNYATMQRIRELKSVPMSPELVFEVHRLVTEDTLEDKTAAGRFRKPTERMVVGDDFGQVFHEPPAAEELPTRLEAMCRFANGEEPNFFIHPAVRAIILHFWLAYDHPFVDGNGRTARALFYWAMLHNHYWLFEYISISHILRKAPAKYGRSFLYTETDNNDLTYFLIAQAKVIQGAICALHEYIERKTAELHEVETHMRALDLFNHRQVEVIRHALKHPGHIYTITGHQQSQRVVYQTARTDLIDLQKRGVFEVRMRGKQMNFVAPSDVGERLLKLQAQADAPRRTEIPPPNQLPLLE
jgi:Fic family protein